MEKTSFIYSEFPLPAVNATACGSHLEFKRNIVKLINLLKTYFCIGVVHCIALQLCFSDASFIKGCLF